MPACPVCVMSIINRTSQKTSVFFTFIVKFDDCCFSLFLEINKLEIDFTNSMIVFVFIFVLHTTPPDNLIQIFTGCSILLIIRRRLRGDLGALTTTGQCYGG